MAYFAGVRKCACHFSFLMSALLSQQSANFHKARHFRNTHTISPHPPKIKIYFFSLVVENDFYSINMYPSFWSQALKERDENRDKCPTLVPQALGQERPFEGDKRLDQCSFISDLFPRP